MFYHSTVNFLSVVSQDLLSPFIQILRFLRETLFYPDATALTFKYMCSKKKTNILIERGQMLHNLLHFDSIFSHIKESENEYYKG